MNNWGGIREHMTKKPRKLFSNRKIIRDVKLDAKYSLKTDFSKEESIKNKKIFKELIIYGLICILVIGFLLF